MNEGEENEGEENNSIKKPDIFQSSTKGFINGLIYVGIVPS